MFEAAGWHCLTVKYGRLLPALFERPGGERAAAPDRRDAQRGVPAAAARLRRRAARAAAGHGRGPARPRRARRRARRRRAAARRPRPRRPRPRRAARRLPGGRRRHRPPVRGLRLHDQGLGAADRGPPVEPLGAALRGAVRARSPASSAPTPGDPWRRFAPDSRGRRLCAERGAAPAARAVAGPPSRPRCRPSSAAATRARSRPSRRSAASSPTSPTRPEEVAERVVTVSPDVASSTNLGGWINRPAIWSIGDRIDWFADDTDTLVRWRETAHGRHIELGIAETNLVGLLGELGATWQLEGEPLLPIGTIYDPFVARALEPWSFGIYAGGQSILVGTPSGITLGARGRGAPVDHDAGDRHRAAGLHRVGAGLRPGLRVGVPARARAARPAGRRARPTSASRPGPLDQELAAVPDRDRPRARSAGGRRSPAATGCAPPGRGRRSCSRHGRADARGARAPPRSSSATRASPPRSSA